MTIRHKLLNGKLIPFGDGWKCPFARSWLDPGAAVAAGPCAAWWRSSGLRCAACGCEDPQQVPERAWSSAPAVRVCDMLTLLYHADIK